MHSTYSRNHKNGKLVCRNGLHTSIFWSPSLTLGDCVREIEWEKVKGQSLL